MNRKQRDSMIVEILEKFKVASRNQLAYLVCKENTNPVNVINRVLKRMTLNGSITQVQRERDKPYLYMPNPTLIHPRTVKMEHYLKIVDFYIHVGCPEFFQAEPQWKTYKPDVYMKDKVGNYVCVEIQLTPISTKKMQTKVEQFISAYGKEHNAKVMLLVSNNEYEKVKIPNTFKIVRISLPKEVYS